MIAVGDRRDAWGRTEFLTEKTITSEPWLVEQKQRLQRERNGALFRSARTSTLKKRLTAADIVREAILRQLRNRTHYPEEDNAQTRYRQSAQ